VGNVNPGQYIVQVTTSPSGTFAQAVFNVTTGPILQLFPTFGPTGTHVTVEGTFFQPSDNPCSLSSPTSGSVVLDGACSFFTASGKFSGFQNVTGSFLVGNVNPGEYVIEVTGCSSDNGCAPSAGDFAQAIFTVTGISTGTTTSSSSTQTTTVTTVSTTTLTNTVTQSATVTNTQTAYVTNTETNSATVTNTAMMTTTQTAYVTVTNTQAGPVQMFVSYSIVGGGSPNAPVFHYVLEGVSESVKLSTVPTIVTADAGTTWSATPNPLGGSASSQQWYSTQPLAGIVSATTIQFVFQHQYYLTMNVNANGRGTVSPNDGWYSAGIKVVITATANGGHNFRRGYLVDAAAIVKRTVCG
jgi:hypothetical protein